MLSLGCERLPTPLKKKKKKKKVLDHYLHHDMGMLPLLPSINQSILFLIKRNIINALSAVQWNTYIFFLV